MKFPRLRIHLLTAIILQIELGVLIWANVRMHAKEPLRPLPPSPPATLLEQLQQLRPERDDYGWPWTAVTSYSIGPKVSATIVFLPEKAPPRPKTEYRYELKIAFVAIDLTICLAILTSTWLACERLLYGKSTAEAAT